MKILSSSSCRPHFTTTGLFERSLAGAHQAREERAQNDVQPAGGPQHGASSQFVSSAVSALSDPNNPVLCPSTATLDYDADNDTKRGIRWWRMHEKTVKNILS